MNPYAVVQDCVYMSVSPVLILMLTARALSLIPCVPIIIVICLHVYYENVLQVKGTVVYMLLYVFLQKLIQQSHFLLEHSCTQK